jgi:type I site-specific restriction endonuclease
LPPSSACRLAPRARVYANQIEAVTNLDHSLNRNRPRALIQLASGSGTTIAAIAAIYRFTSNSAPSGESRFAQRNFMC